MHVTLSLNHYQNLVTFQKMGRQRSSNADIVLTQNFQGVSCLRVGLSLKERIICCLAPLPGLKRIACLRQGLDRIQHQREQALSCFLNTIKECFGDNASHHLKQNYFLPSGHQYRSTLLNAKKIHPMINQAASHANCIHHTRIQLRQAAYAACHQLKVKLPNGLLLSNADRHIHPYLVKLQQLYQKYRVPARLQNKLTERLVCLFVNQGENALAPLTQLPKIVCRCCQNSHYYSPTVPLSNPQAKYFTLSPEEILLIDGSSLPQTQKISPSTLLIRDCCLILGFYQTRSGEDPSFARKANQGALLWLIRQGWAAYQQSCILKSEAVDYPPAKAATTKYVAGFKASPRTLQTSVSSQCYQALLAETSSKFEEESPNSRRDSPSPPHPFPFHHYLPNA